MGNGTEWCVPDWIGKQKNYLKVVSEIGKSLSMMSTNRIKNKATSVYRQLNTSISTIDRNARIVFENLTRRHHPVSMIILDDIFPHLSSGFRIAEYNAYLSKFEDAEVHSTGKAFSIINESSGFQEIKNEYVEIFPDFESRVFRYDQKRKLNSEFVYLIFLHNTFGFLDHIEKNHRPFVFTLYPGGGFRLGVEQSDNMLRRIFSSPSFTRVIVTQKVSYDYLVQGDYCPTDSIDLIYGGVLPMRFSSQPKKYYGQDKGTFDICFVANRYSPGGVDKGFDIFIEVARHLSKLSNDIHFHIVGNFAEEDGDLEGVHNIIFYGRQPGSFFNDFYPYMDIILSPNISFILAPGAFDGFPTGACVEAGLSGVAVICTDDLGQNNVFTNEVDIRIVTRSIAEITDTIEEYFQHPSSLYKLAETGQRRFQELFSFETQMNPRFKIIEHVLNNKKVSLDQDGLI